MLDIRTLVLNLLLFTLVFSLGMLLVQRGQAMGRGLRCWALANGLAGTAFLLVALRGVIGDFLSVIVANDLLLVALFCFHEGVARLRGRDGHGRRAAPPLLGLLTLTLLWYTYAEPSVPARIVAVMLLNSVPAAMTLWLLISGVPRRLRASHWFTGAAFAQLIVFHLVRLAHTLVYPPSDVMEGGWVQALGFLSVFVLVLMSAFGCVWMVTDYLTAELEKQARTDPLTGAGNRLALEEELTRELKRSLRSGRPLSVLLFDLDHFKKLNDRLGHQRGDEALAQVAAIARRELRAGDLLVRYGGEEFLVVLPDTDPRRAAETADRLRRRIESAAISCGGSTRLTASFGVAGFPGHGDTPAALIGHADHMLYLAKSDGRNRVQPGMQTEPAPLETAQRSR